MNRAIRQVVVVGGGVGGLRTAQELRRLGYTGSIAVAGDEAELPYDRPPLSKQILAGQWPESRAQLISDDKLDDLAVNWHLGVRAAGVIDGSVILDTGVRLAYDALVVATGVRPRALRGQADSSIVYNLRTLDHARALRAALADAGTVLIVGAGFIGAEVASTARAAGKAVTVVEALPAPFVRSMGNDMGRYCARLLAENDVDLLCGVSIAGLEDRGSTAVATLHDGRTLTSDCVVASIGSRPNTEWLAALGIEPDAALACDQYGLVNGHTNVYAVGDVAAWHQPRYGDQIGMEHWTSATAQASVVAHSILGVQPTLFADDPPYFWSDQFGIKIQLVGRPDLAQEVRLLRDPGSVRGICAGYFKDGRIIAALTFGAPKLFVECRKLVASSACASHVSRTLSELGDPSC